MKTKVERILERHAKLKLIKDPWLTTWQTIGELVRAIKQDFQGEHQPGQFLTGDIFDSTAASANHLMGSTMIGALYPNGSKTFRLKAPDDLGELADRDEVKEFYEGATKTMVAAMDDAEAGLLTSLDEYMGDQGAFGTSGIEVCDNMDPDSQYDVPVKFSSVDVKQMSIAEGKDGTVDTVYVQREITIRQAEQEYGLSDLSPQTQTAYKQGRLEDKIKILNAVEPRAGGSKGGFGNNSMPIASIHIEIDAKHILRESGYMTMPILVTRFWKATGEVYGRSPASEGMPDIVEINGFRELSIIATEKLVSPPLVVTEDGATGGGIIDTSARSITVRHVNGRIGDAGGRIIEPMYTVGELSSTYKRIDILTETINNHFFKDRLLDFNNEVRMTLGEATLRNELRGQSLGTIYARQMTELFSPMIRRVFSILLRKGLLGVIKGSKQAKQLELAGVIPRYIPNEIADRMIHGGNVFDIDYTSPAARIMQSEETMGIQRLVEFAVKVAVEGQRPDILDNIDFDIVVRKFQHLTGAPSEIIRSAEAVQNIRNDRAKQQNQMAQMQNDKLEADTARASGAAIQSLGKARQAS